MCFDDSSNSLSSSDVLPLAVHCYFFNPRIAWYRTVQKRTRAMLGWGIVCTQNRMETITNTPTQMRNGPNPKYPSLSQGRLHIDA